MGQIESSERDETEGERREEEARKGKAQEELGGAP